jgi:hypothetical protein
VNDRAMENEKAGLRRLFRLMLAAITSWQRRQPEQRCRPERQEQQRQEQQERQRQEPKRRQQPGQREQPERQEQQPEQQELQPGFRRPFRRKQPETVPTE